MDYFHKREYMEFKNSINCICPDFILILSLFISCHCALGVNPALPQSVPNFHSSISQQCTRLPIKIKERLGKTVHWIANLKHHLICSVLVPQYPGSEPPLSFTLALPTWWIRLAVFTPSSPMQTGELTDFASVHMRIFNALTSQTQ